jgi:hypothetical protein
MPFKLKTNEHDIYFTAYSNSKGKDDASRTIDAENAVKAHRAGADGAMKAVDKGIKEGSLRDRIRSRKKKIDEAG